MKIAVASDGSNVSGHFGHCEGFTTYEVKDGTAGDMQYLSNPGHRPGYLPEFLKEHNVKAIVAGGMGARAQELFHENGIEVFVGVQGTCDAAADSYARGELKSTGSVCSEHAYEGHCND